MTNREFYTNISNGIVGEAEIEHAASALASLDARNAARREKPTKAQLEALGRAENVAGYFMSDKDKVSTRDEIAEALGISPSQVTAAVKAINDGKVNTLCRVGISKAKFDKSTKTVYSYTDSVDEGD